MAISSQSVLTLRLILAATLTSACLVSHSLDLSTEVSGFGRIVAGYLDEPDATYSGYSDEITAKPNSLLGLQGTVNAGEQLRLTALGLVSHEKDWDADLEWFYLGYRPTSNWDLKIGRMHTPFFRISDSLEVGYAYPWIVPPQEVYRDTMVRYFEGGSIQYGVDIQDIVLNAEIYSGSYQDEAVINNTAVDLTLESLQGYILQIKWREFTARGSFHTGDVQMSLGSIDSLRNNLALAGFGRSANSIDTDGNTDFYQVGLDYHGLNYFAWTEWTRIVPSQRLFASSQGHYVGFGRYIDSLTLALTYANLKDDKPSAVEGEIPSGFNPQLDALKAGYDTLFNTWPHSEATSWMLSSRWEYNTQVALKAEYKRIEESSPYNTTLQSERVKDKYHSNLFLFAVEWLF